MERDKEGTDCFQQPNCFIINAKYQRTYQLFVNFNPRQEYK